MKRYSNAKYDGIECVVDEVQDSDGGNGTHSVITKDGVTPVRTGDYVIHGLVRTPRDMAGYHSDTVAKVVRGKDGKPRDSKLELGDADDAVIDEDERQFVDEDDDDDYAESDDNTDRGDSKRNTPQKATPAKVTPATLNKK